MVRKASRGVQADCVLDACCHSRRKAACWKEPGEPSCPQRLPTTWLCPQGHNFALWDLGASLWGCTASGLLPTGADLGREVVLGGLGRSSWELGSAGEGALGEAPMSKVGWGSRGKLRLVEFWGWMTLQSCPTWRLGHSRLCHGPGPLWGVAGRVLHSS